MTIITSTVMTITGTTNRVIVAMKAMTTKRKTVATTIMSTKPVDMTIMSTTTTITAMLKGTTMPMIFLKA